VTKPVQSARPTSLILLLDIDGTLVDTDAHLSQTMEVLFKKYGVAFKPEEFFLPKTFLAPNEQGVMETQTTMLFGATWEMAYYYLKSLRPFPDPGVAAFRDEIINHVTSHRDGIVVRQDIVDMVLRLKEQCAAEGLGFSVVAVTNGARREAIANLDMVEAAGLKIDKLVSADDVMHRKPDPEPYRIGHRIGSNVLRAQGFDPKGAMVVKLEDSPPGAISAVIAAQDYDGMCYYVPTLRRPLLLPKLTPEQEPYFVIMQDIATLTSQLEIQLRGRSELPHQLGRIARADTAP